MLRREKILTSLFYFIALSAGFVISAARISSANFSSEMPNPNFGNPNEKIVNEAESWLKALPKSDREAWLDYVSRISNIHAGSSESIEKANLALTQNPCFSDVAANFYSWLMEQDIHSDRIFLQDPNRPLGGRPSLVDQMGVAQNSKFTPGAVWQKAMEMSGGQPNLAMAVIGLCGHDDRIQIKPGLLPDRIATEKFRETKKLLLARLRDDVLKKIKDGNLEATKEAAEFLEDLVEHTGPEEINHLFCPNTSLLFVPQALGADLDLDPRLKERIIRVQAPQSGGKVLPANPITSLAAR